MEPMEYLMLLVVVLVSAFVGGYSYSTTQAIYERKSFCFLAGLLTSLTILGILMISTIYAPRFILGY